MHQVLMNLLSNSLDAVEPGQGLIRVIARYEAEHQTSVIEVIDNGTGIPPTMAGHLFELFHSTKGNRGTGLGLAVARKIVEEHEGSISVQSSPTEGNRLHHPASRRQRRHGRRLQNPRPRKVSRFPSSGILILILHF